ncbi:hypothetical protein GCM10027404_22240 [Arthrobacter tumbae]|nr:hypothetical protein [Arthrobacter tumbae]
MPDTGRSFIRTETLTITTQRTERCPVLPLTITDDQGRAAISLGQVPTNISCGTAQESFFTITELPPDSQEDLPLFYVDGQAHEVETQNSPVQR